jgi:hypothetical protein
MKDAANNTIPSVLLELCQNRLPRDRSAKTTAVQDACVKIVNEGLLQNRITKRTKTKLRGLSPGENNTDRETSACRRS